jgi:uncharacterized damage-inducible protein DinB
MADTLADYQIFKLTKLNDDLYGSLDWVSEQQWTRRPAEGEWSVAEIVGHVIELEPYWARQAAKLAEQPGAAIGRTLEDPVRLSGPQGGLALTPKEARTRVAQAGEEAAELLRKVPDSAWSTAGSWRGGEMTLGRLVQEHLVDHVRAHLEQATAALSPA